MCFFRLADEITDKSTIMYVKKVYFFSFASTRSDKARDEMTTAVAGRATRDDNRAAAAEEGRDPIAFMLGPVDYTRSLASCCDFVGSRTLCWVCGAPRSVQGSLLLPVASNGRNVRKYPLHLSHYTQETAPAKQRATYNVWLLVTGAPAI